jgi:vancomycin permeability regulator SanA
MKFLIRSFFFLVSISIFILLLPRLVTAIYARTRMVQVEEAPTKPFAIVFGAGLRRDGGPTQVLRDRVHTAADLYFAGKVEHLIMSGHNPSPYYNEPAAMRQFALDLGVPDDAIILDLGGDRTLETCARAKDVYGVTNAFLVSQSFHLPRAIYICNRLDVSAVGVSADRFPYRNRAMLYWNLREIPATLVAFWELFFSGQGAVVATAARDRHAPF